MNKIGASILRIKRRVRLYAVCKKIGIKPKKMQSEFVLHGNMPLPHGRQTGKTTAVLLKTLVQMPKTPRSLYDALSVDPDFSKRLEISAWTYHEYRRLHEKCKGLWFVRKTVTKELFLQEAIRRRQNREHGLTEF